MGFSSSELTGSPRHSLCTYMGTATETVPRTACRYVGSCLDVCNLGYPFDDLWPGMVCHVMYVCTVRTR